MSATSLGRTSSSGMGLGQLHVEARTEQGYIESVDIDKGLCTVVTTSGRRLERVRPPLGVSSAGGGQRATPMVNSACLICYFMPDPNGSAYILQVYEPTTTDGRAGEWGSPGAWQMNFDSGGHVSFTQDGVVDLSAEPGCRLVLIPGHRETKLWTEQLDVMFSPLSTMRMHQDDEMGSSFFELFVNSRYLHRKDDATPDVGLMLGDQVKSERTSPYNPKTDFLAHLYTEARDSTDGSAVTHRTDWLSGNVEGVAQMQRVDAVADGVAYTERIGFFDGTNGSAARDATLEADGEPVWMSELASEGTLRLMNPTWNITVPAGTDAPLLVQSEKTQVEMLGDQIKVGLGQHEPMVLGDTLQGLLEEAIDEILAIVLPTTTGVTTGPPINAPKLQALRARLGTLKSKKNHVS